LERGLLSIGYGGVALAEVIRMLTKGVGVGMWSEHNFCGGLYGLSVALFTRALGWTAEQLEVFLVGVRKDLRNRQIHAYWPM
jgi:hypothetical protein